jgi:oxygen-independent coproporphyrinogen-3 oxidase
MVEETEENWRDSVRQAIELAPDSITIYQMEIPYNTQIYQEMKAQGRLTAPVADWETKRGWVRYAFAELEKAGYSVASGYTAVRDPKRTHFIYRDSLWQGADLIGLGVASFSHVGGTHFQNEHDFEPYVARLREGLLPLHRALTPTPDERLIREVVLQFKLGRISRAYFQHKFGVDILARFAEPLARLKAQGVLTIDGDWLRLSRDGLLEVDKLVHEFFLPEHRTARYA